MEGIHAPAKIQASTNDDVREKIASVSRDKYHQEPKPLQVETVLNLLRGRNTFLLAATGFGKSRISELYLQILPKNTHGEIIGVVVVLNPLDALGDNQVEEKVAAGFTAINLTKPNVSHEVCQQIQDGFFNFVYLSPEMFLDNEEFSNVYFSPKFQSKLALVVVDEAHMVYSWGLVESGQKKLKTIVRHQDFSAFRPHYGSLATQLLTKNQAPLLLMSATCRPAAITLIKKNLKLLDNHIDILRDELTRPEIRILRIPMKSSIQSCADVLHICGPKSHIPDDQMVPSLIYSGTRMRTLQVLEVLDQARETPSNHLNPCNSFARRYHACTGDMDKKDVIDDFASGKVPVLSCTLALGMGQNWKLVRQIVHIGRGDPSLICQMVGRCGRDGRPGLALLFVEPNRPKGKNSIEEFPPGHNQSDEDRMDALAITPDCIFNG
jgi:superfamily II DNA helicase RecQ